MASVVMTEINTHVYALCSHRRDISVCIITRYDITLKVLEHSSNVKEYPLWNCQGITRHIFPRERLEYNEERDW